MVCEVCLVDVSKYKCSKCLLKYCSVVCYKKHASSESDECEKKRKLRTETELEKAVEGGGGGGDKQSRNELGCCNREEKKEEEEDRVPSHKLELLRSDSRLLDCLRNPHVRNIVSSLDRSSNPSTDILAAMMEPIFVEFADHCLRIVETPR